MGSIVTAVYVHLSSPCCSYLFPSEEEKEDVCKTYNRDKDEDSCRKAGCCEWLVGSEGFGEVGHTFLLINFNCFSVYMTEGRKSAMCVTLFSTKVIVRIKTAASG